MRGAPVPKEGVALYWPANPRPDGHTLLLQKLPTDLSTAQDMLQVASQKQDAFGYMAIVVQEDQVLVLFETLAGHQGWRLEVREALLTPGLRVTSNPQPFEFTPRTSPA